MFTSPDSPFYEDSVAKKIYLERIIVISLRCHLQKCSSERRYYFLITCTNAKFHRLLESSVRPTKEARLYPKFPGGHGRVEMNVCCSIGSKHRLRLAQERIVLVDRSHLTVSNRYFLGSNVLVLLQR